jgi:hypothetical protein
VLAGGPAIAITSVSGVPSASGLGPRPGRTTGSRRARLRRCVDAGRISVEHLLPGRRGCGASETSASLRFVASSTARAIATRAPAEAPSPAPVGSATSTFTRALALRAPEHRAERLPEPEPSSGRIRSPPSTSTCAAGRAIAPRRGRDRRRSRARRRIRRARQQDHFAAGSGHRDSELSVRDAWRSRGRLRAAPYLPG